MKREDFRKITDEHFKVCEKIIEKDGACYGTDFIIHCDECPFTNSNNHQDKGCYENDYTRKTHRGDKDVILVNSAKKFLKFRPSRLTVVKIDEEELSKYPKYYMTTPDGDKVVGELKAVPRDAVKKQTLEFRPSKLADAEEEHDVVNKPGHYQLNVNGEIIQVKDIANAVIENMIGRKAAYVWNVVKYILRAEKKNGIEDYKKARKYLDFIIGEIGE